MEPSLVISVADLDDGPRSVRFELSEAWVDAALAGSEASSAGPGQVEVELLKNGSQVMVRGQIAGHHHDARCFHIQAMHDTGPGQLRQLRRMGQQGVDQGAIGVAGGGMNHQPGRLVQHQYAGIFIHDIKVYGLWLPAYLHHKFGADRQGFALGNLVPGPALFATHQQLPVPDPGLQPGTGILRKQAGGRLVEALTIQFRRHLGHQLYDFLHTFPVYAPGRLWLNTAAGLG